MKTKEIIKLTAGIFILIAAIGTTYYIAEGDQAYYCEDTNLVGLCFKLSKVNDAGFQTRCYYNESAPTRFKNCKTGWIEYKGLNVTGEPINDSFIYYDINFTKDVVYKLKDLNISDAEIGPCMQTYYPWCVAILKLGSIKKELVVDFMDSNLTKKDLENMLIEKAKEELNKLVWETIEPDPIQHTNPIKIDLKEI